MNLVHVLAYKFRLTLPAAFMQPGTRLFIRVPYTLGLNVKSFQNQQSYIYKSHVLYLEEICSTLPFPLLSTPVHNA